MRLLFISSDWSAAHGAKLKMFYSFLSYLSFFDSLRVWCVRVCACAHIHEWWNSRTVIVANEKLIQTQTVVEPIDNWVWSVVYEGGIYTVISNCIPVAFGSWVHRPTVRDSCKKLFSRFLFFFSRFLGEFVCELSSVRQMIKCMFTCFQCNNLSAANYSIFHRPKLWKSTKDNSIKVELILRLCFKLKRLEKIVPQIWMW